MISEEPVCDEPSKGRPCCAAARKNDDLVRRVLAFRPSIAIDALAHARWCLGALFREPVVEEAEGDPNAGGDGRLRSVGGLGWV